jgi:acyl dehydratase
LLDRHDQTPAVGAKASRGITVTETHVVLYAGLAGDLDPMALDSGFAAQSGAGERLAPLGLLVGMAVGVAHELLPSGRFTPVSLHAEPTGLVYIGETLNCAAELSQMSGDRVEIAMRASTEKSSQVLTGKLIVRLHE